MRQKAASIYAARMAQIERAGLGELAGIQSEPTPHISRPCLDGHRYTSCKTSCAFWTPKGAAARLGCIWFADPARRLGSGMSDYRAAPKEEAS